MKEILEEIESESSTTAEGKQILRAIGDLQKTVDEIASNFEKEKIVDFTIHDISAQKN